ncbi:MAG: hypothetical protein MUE85_03075 [Microscillaceae bacterium]|jgi:hypothetical protein|nr:hypothetical protein [Microscillaceae bacterium]
METTLKSSQTIKWQHVWSLVALDVAIIISWIAYHEYQPKLLEQFKFTEFSFNLKVIQGIILFLTPPLAGLIADRIRHQKGDRLPVINVGINFVSMVFMAVAFTVLAEPSGVIRWFFPLMIVLWLVSMNIFHSPAISTVELFVPAHKLPQVMAIFAVVAGIAEAIEPSIVDIIDYFGAPATFGLGGVLVFGTGWLLKRMTQSLTTQNEASENVGYQAVKQSNYLLVFLMGLGFGISTMIFFKLFPNWAELQLSFLKDWQWKGSFFTSILIALAAILSFPVSSWVEKRNLQNSAWLGFGLVAAFAGLILLKPIGGLGIVWFGLFPLAYAILSVTTLPIAFLNLDARNKVLGIGLFFSAVELPNSLLEILQSL